MLTPVRGGGNLHLHLLPESFASDSAGVQRECKRKNRRHPIIRASNKTGISLACDIQ